MAEGNLLVRGGRLSALIDFGGCGVGDPASDLVIAWTWFEDAEARLFRGRLDLDEDTWDRGAGWALWKALVTLQRPDEASLHPWSHRTLDRLRRSFVP